MTAEQLAKLFHDGLARLAPQYGFEITPEMRNFDPTMQNGRLLLDVCEEILDHIAEEIPVEIL